MIPIFSKPNEKYQPRFIMESCNSKHIIYPKPFRSLSQCYNSQKNVDIDAGADMSTETDPFFAKSPPKLITFDATNTLIELRAEVGVYYREAWMKANRQGSKTSASTVPSKEAYTKAFVKSFKEMNVKYPSFGRDAQMNIETQISSREWWKTVVQKTFLYVYIDNDGFSNKQDEIKKWKDETMESKMMQDIFESLYMGVFVTPQAWKLRPGVKDLLQSLKQKQEHHQNLKLAVLSNNDDRLPILLKNMGLLEYFDHVFTSAELGLSKPNRQIFERVLTHYDLMDHPEQCIHIGDHFQKDIMGATNVGLRALHIDISNNSVEDIDEKSLGMFKPIQELTEVLDI